MADRSGIRRPLPTGPGIQKIWIDLSHKAAFDLNPNGSLHLAYHEDEKSVLREFVETHRDHRPVVWLNPNDLAQKHPSVNHHGLKGGMYSADEMLVDPVEAIQKISFWLQTQASVYFISIHRSLLLKAIFVRALAKTPGRSNICLHRKGYRSSFPGDIKDTGSLV